MTLHKRKFPDLSCASYCTNALQNFPEDQNTDQNTEKDCKITNSEKLHQNDPMLRVAYTYVERGQSLVGYPSYEYNSYDFIENTS